MAPVISKYLPLCHWSADVALRDHKKNSQRVQRENVIPRRIDCYNEDATSTLSLSPAARTAYGSVESGEARLKSLINALNRLDTLGYRRSKGQRQFHKAFIGACLKKIYGDAIYADLARLLREYDLDQLKSDVIICTPRRFGKTMSVALFVAAYLYTQPNAEISIFSTARRASRKILALVWQMVVKLAGTHKCVVSYNQEFLEIHGPGDQTSKCHSYPARVSNKRVVFCGQAGRLLLP